MLPVLELSTVELLEAVLVNVEDSVAVALTEEVVDEELVLSVVERVDSEVKLVVKLLLDVLVTVDVDDEDVGEGALTRKTGFSQSPG